MIEELEAFSRAICVKPIKNVLFEEVAESEAEYVVRTVSAFFGVNPIEVYKVSRKSDVVLIRHIVFYVLRKEKYTLNSIGEHFGKDHSTIIHGIKSIENYLSIPSHPTTKKINTILNQLI